MSRMWPLIGVLALVWSLASGVCAQPVRTEAGALQGVREGAVTVFKAVPYAAPPVGDLRWREPRPAARWKGVRKADAFAPACMQKGVSMPGETPPKVSEDCLYLNVWTPRRHRGAALPVIVWIHGGGWTNGSASMPLYRGDRLAAKGAVVVTVGYRLGPLGFLAHPELSRESGHGVSGDYGLMDQIAALQWVRRNISAFGGDPRRVTIAGQSAGAMAVSALMASPQARGLFQRAIAQSGGLFEPLQLAPSYRLPSAEKDGVAYAASLGAHSLADLRRLPAERLLEGQANMVSHPVVGTEVLPLSPYEAFAAGTQSDTPLLLGSNAEEARSLVDLKPVRAASLSADIARSFGDLPPPLLDAYPHATDEQARQARADFERDLRFGWDMWAWARLQAATGKAPIFAYRFTRRPPFPAGSPYEGWGASHFAELWYMSDHLDQYPTWAWSPADRALADRMSTYWINFARTGDPNGPGLPAWPAFTGENGRTQYLGDTITTGGVADLDKLKVFDGVYSAVRGAPFGRR
ncbi:MAG: carboxylesterase family protein [Proteobacteria bacterium]|nr:carboxylesterase family protein [Pseudomonadota bacterium]